MTASENITVALVGTCDTKLQELLRLKRLIVEAGASSVILIDVGSYRVEHEGIDVSRDKTPGYAAHREAELTKADRGGCIKIIAECASHYVQSLYEEGKIHGIISAGGSGGTTLAASVMREALPIGFPKLIVSTIASGDTGPLVGESDVTMMYSVVDIAGSNTLLNRIFSNAAGAIVGMARAWASSAKEDSKKQKKKVGITMFGVTTPCVNIAREVLESKYGFEAGQLDAVLDITTTEVCDHLMGGNMSAGGTRLEAAPKAGIPYVVSVGATDMVNFGPRATVPDKYSNRQLYQHNSMVTLMRTTAEECKMVGDFIAEKLRRFALDQKKVKVVLPKGGVSMIATPGAPFAAAEADRATFEAIVSGLQGTDIEVIERNEAINEEDFAQGIANTLAAMLPA
ncbi:hypothetical protein DL769_001412 [Monosporascus sp. CRB-8-3]|nr:hypothetical protein DL769_001412 [Monosporascus sp. CRB-8-3]